MTLADDAESATDPEPTHDAMVEAIAVLEQLAADRGLLERLSQEEMHRLMRAAEGVAVPDRVSRMKLRRAIQKREKAALAEQKAADESLLAQTGIRKQFAPKRIKQACAPAPFEPEPPPANTQPDDQFGPRLQVARSCYICKRDYDRVHQFYDSMCPDCASLNWTKRNQTADLSGRYALLTGGRVKIGFQAALKLLRAGAYVVVTTRFPRDASQRFLDEADSGDWKDRLQLYGIDLRHTPSVELLAEHLVATLPRLDFLLNNACQTVRRPPGFYAHLMEGETRSLESLPAAAEPLLKSYEQLRGQGLISPTNGKTLPAQVRDSLAGIQRAAELSQIPLAPGDHAGGAEIFPTGQYDHDLQQVDLRSINSWRLPLADVPTVELLEVHLVNAVAPFILNARLKPLMVRVPTRDKHIVNVSAMEGIFYRAYKTDKHPHTNMAKAALNMMTRTSAQDYVADGIHMNSVDTGWITDEDPADIAERKREELGFHPPLDTIDAAARICDPIFAGMLSGEHLWGNFLKDYQVANW
ncbi:Fatty acyl-CoA reductase [Symmachiella dynata]|uniref:Fatty acyl-CoA reductase n=1 Tax=Symmachiella dynata TaxID=2527995 RepID=A0A517ZJK4_9PLAN|nr:SDR family oxidoreductase [Symmachiella dynata]QDU42660.1 Fatty acyl-CoA reductase [Symmachiella dynata]